MRVSISGSHSTGKTCLAQACYDALHTRLPGQVSLIQEVAREVIAKGFPLNRDATVDAYTTYILLQLAGEREAGTAHAISDRSLIDLVAYMRTNAAPHIPRYFQQMVEEIVWREKEYFDLYCYLPIEFPLVVDDVRPEEEAYRAAVDRTLIEVLDHYRVAAVEVRGTLEDRRDQVLALF